MGINLWNMDAVSYWRGCQHMAWVVEEMLTKGVLTGSCRPLSLMHYFLTLRLLRQIICLRGEKIIKLPKITENYRKLWMTVVCLRFAVFSIFNLTPLSLSCFLHNYFGSLLLYFVISFLCLVPFFSISFPSSFSLSFYLSPLFPLFPLPPSLCPEALATDCVVWGLNEAVPIQ